MVCRVLLRPTSAVMSTPIIVEAYSIFCLGTRAYSPKAFPSTKGNKRALQHLPHVTGSASPVSPLGASQWEEFGHLECSHRPPATPTSPTWPSINHVSAPSLQVSYSYYVSHMASHSSGVKELVLVMIIINHANAPSLYR